MFREEVHVNCYGFTRITAMVIIYIYVLFIVLLISFIFNFFYCYYIILERNILLFLRAERGKKAPQETKMAEECRRESR